ncbi:hypothetical protein ACJX0J_024211, partial [Zea mays]
SCASATALFKNATQEEGPLLFNLSLHFFAESNFHTLINYGSMRNKCNLILGHLDRGHKSEMS